MGDEVRVKASSDIKQRVELELLLEGSASFQLFRKLESNGVSATTGNEKIDKLMKDAIIVLRIHLIELQKVASLAEDFHTKYLQALRKRVSHDVLVGSTGDSDDDMTEPSGHDELLSSRLQDNAVATLTTSQGTVSISFDPRTVLAGIHSVSAVKSFSSGREFKQRELVEYSTRSYRLEIMCSAFPYEII
ncbi:hypothetical protein OESDEN_01355 [Oesophagostomum dentatum]|uniref:MEIS N-terminal domain-containing protein n=1 Tax=Oesophagostomum dentatum TaxID=61180 RepID=A0A0B1TMC1_OESDE|nr:hypothetical protein OESDEN_01355 [Oesophagostomum dentatum]